MTTDASRGRVRLKYCAHIEMGQSPPSAEYSSLPEDGLPFLQGTADFGAVSPTPYVYCGSPTKLARAGDILFSVRAPVGEINLADQEFGIGRGLCAIRPQRHWDARFVWWALHEARYQLNFVSTGSTYDAVAVEDVGNLLVETTDFDSQRAIAAYLDHETARLDALVAAKERLLDLLAEKRRALITRAVTRGLAPNVPLRDSGVPWLGKVPVHWQVTRLKFVSRVQTGLALGKVHQARVAVEYPYLRVANVQDGFLDLSDVKTVSVPEQEAHSYLLRAGDVLMNEGGDSDKLGRGAIWTGEIDPCLHQNHVFAVRAREVFPAWLALWISSDHAKAYFESRSKQSTNLASISATNLMEMPMLRPPESEQSAIVGAVHHSVQKIDAVHSAIERTARLLKERLSALIAAAVTGQIDVEEKE